jgi:hypothetical protein
LEIILDVDYFSDIDRLATCLYQRRPPTAEAEWQRTTLSREKDFTEFCRVLYRIGDRLFTSSFGETIDGTVMHIWGAAPDIGGLSMRYYVVDNAGHRNIRQSQRAALLGPGLVK